MPSETNKNKISLSVDSDRSIKIVVPTTNLMKFLWDLFILARVGISVMETRAGIIKEYDYPYIGVPRTVHLPFPPQ